MSQVAWRLLLLAALVLAFGLTAWWVTDIGPDGLLQLDRRWGSSLLSFLFHGATLRASFFRSLARSCHAVSDASWSVNSSQDNSGSAYSGSNSTSDEVRSLDVRRHSSAISMSCPSASTTLRKWAHDWHNSSAASRPYVSAATCMANPCRIQLDVRKSALGNTHALYVYPEPHARLLGRRDIST